MPIDALLEMSSEERVQIIREVCQRKGVSIRQLERVVGVNRLLKRL